MTLSSNWRVGHQSKLKLYFVYTNDQESNQEGDQLDLRKSQIIRNKSKAQSIVKNKGVSGHRSRFNDVLSTLSRTASRIGVEQHDESLLSKSQIDLSRSHLGVVRTRRNKPESSGSRFVDDMNQRMESLLGRFVDKRIRRNKYKY